MTDVDVTPIVTEDGIQWATVMRVLPIWASVPAEQRVTEEDIINRQRVQWCIDKDVEALRNPQCELAVRWLEVSNTKWAPCKQKVAPGATRCRKHGGPPAVANEPKPT